MHASIKLSLVASLLAVAPALASSSYPSAIRERLQLDVTPSCTLCHTSASGGGGTAHQPVGEALSARGLGGGGDVGALNAALDALEADVVDSDDDGTSDIDELHASTDPNTAGTSVAEAPIAYGFGCASTPLPAFGALAVLGLLAVRRRRLAGLALLAGITGCTIGYPPGTSDTPPPGAQGDRCGTGLYWTGGDEESPFMHPGGDCIGCHRSEDEGPRYALAGTVMSSIDDETDCVGVGGVQVDVLDNTGAVALSITSNESGNFFSSSALAADALPYTIRLTRDGRTSTMATPQTELNCVLCHGATGASGSPGRIIAP